MLNSFLVVGSSVLTLFLMMAVGFVLGKLGMLSKETLSQLSRLLLCVVSPAIMIDTFLGEERTAAAVRGLLIAGAVLVVTYVLNMVLVQLLFRRSGEKGVLRFACMYGNTGFMGIPLIQTVLGPAGMMPTVISLVVFNITTWTHGSALIGGRLSLKKGLLNPGTIGFVLAAILFGLQVELPAPVMKAVGTIGSLNTPLAMVVIGAQMSAVDFRELVRDGRGWLVSAVKLLAMPVVTMLVMLPLKLEPVTFMAIAILAACPVAGATSLFCQINGKDPSMAARTVTLSTVLCIITLPAVAAVAGMLAGT